MLGLGCEVHQFLPELLSKLPWLVSSAYKITDLAQHHKRIATTPDIFIRSAKSRLTGLPESLKLLSFEVVA